MAPDFRALSNYQWSLSNAQFNLHFKAFEALFETKLILAADKILINFDFKILQ